MAPPSKDQCFAGLVAYFCLAALEIMFVCCSVGEPCATRSSESPASKQTASRRLATSSSTLVGCFLGIPLEYNNKVLPEILVHQLFHLFFTSKPKKKSKAKVVETGFYPQTNLRNRNRSQRTTWVALPVPLSRPPDEGKLWPGPWGVAHPCFEETIPNTI